MTAPPVNQYSFASRIAQPVYPVDGLASSGSQYDAYPGVIMPMGTAGAGVGVCPEQKLPVGFKPMFDAANRYSPNFGNYIAPDGSIMVFRPKHYYKITPGSNVVDIKGIDTFPTTAQANAAGYALCRSFIDGGVELCGKFDDKYFCSANSGKASSIKNGLVLTSDPTHNPLTQIPGATNISGEAIRIAVARNGYSHCMSLFDKTSLARISLAHGQACSSNQFCGWYDGTYNFPKGNNSNTLSDINDGSLTFTSDGFQFCSKTGSGSPFEKTTHNGQLCGVTDMNGTVYSTYMGMTQAFGTSLLISAMTNANPCQITFSAPHGLVGSGIGFIAGCLGMVEPNNKFFTYTYVDPTNITINVNSTAFGIYSGSGSMTTSAFYIAKLATKIRDFTSGDTLATDHFGPTGVANMMQTIAVPVNTTYPNNISGQFFGSGANQVFSEAVSGDDWLRTGAGIPLVGGTDTVGTNLFGTDYYYYFYADEIFPVGNGASYVAAPTAGIWVVAFSVARYSGNAYFGFRCSSLPLV